MREAARDDAARTRAAPSTRAAAADVRLGVNFQARHNDAVLAARDTVARGAIGDVVLVECEVAYPGGAPSGWRADRELAGLGTIHNLGVHAFDLIRFVCGAEFAAGGGNARP